MIVNRMALRHCAAVLLVLLSVSGLLWAKNDAAATLARVRIDNFGRINGNYYRGAQPDATDYRDLAAVGIKTVIDLTRDGCADEKRLVERAGMKFYRIPLTTSERPSEAAIARFLRLVDDPANQPIYVHCQGGRHRTGVMTAVYRMTHDSWTADKAYAEMKQYRFEGFPGHPVLKSFVYDYFANLDRSRIADEHHVSEGAAAK
jgi:protein tyrosine/serine phosphatase